MIYKYSTSIIRFVFVTFFLAGIFSADAYAPDPPPYGQEGTLSANTTGKYDSLLAVWYERNIVSSYDVFFDEFINIDSTAYSNIPDSVYRARMKMVLSPINMGYNDVVKRYIAAYTGNKKELMGRILGLSQIYFPMIEEELARCNLPLELRMLPVIESALNPTAVSRAGATGLWQFMYRTGKSYGLEITSFVDQRRDPIIATKAACRYLSDLYSMYGDWTLAIAAYNCGPGNVNKALKRAGGNAATFWEIYPYLPRETRGYMPSFIAATYAYTFHRQHQIELVAPPIPISTDTVMIGRLTHFGQISSTLGIPIETLRALNPQYKMDIIPSVEKPYALTLPQYDITRYLERETEIHGKDTLYLAQYLRQPTDELIKRLTATAAATSTYKVKSGDTLGAIARKNGVTVSQLMKWNNIKNANSLRIGQTLEIRK